MSRSAHCFRELLRLQTVGLWLGALAQIYSIPIDPCQFDNGPATVGLPSIQFEKGGQLTKRLQAIKEAKNEIWDYLTLFKLYKWTTLKGDIMEGDVVQRKDESAASHSNKYARVIRTHKGGGGKLHSSLS